MIKNLEALSFCQLPTYWSLKGDQALYDKISRVAPSIQVFNDTQEIPAQKRVTITNEQESPIARPNRHWRAFYLNLEKIIPHEKGCLAIKGSEALSDNIPELLEKIKPVHSIYSWSTRKSGLGMHNSDHALLTMCDRYLFVENKIPLLYLLSEAIDEVQSTIALQKAYISRYDTIANIPIPLAIYKISPYLLKNCDVIFEKFYDEKRYAMIRNLMKDGVAIQVYWYPTIPHRVAHIDFPTADSLSQFQERMTYLSSVMNVERCIEKWLTLFCRFLNMGFLAVDPVSACKGYCIDPGNLVLDGGMVDLGSMRHIDTFHHKAEIQFVFENSIKLFIESIMALLIGRESMSQGFKSVFPDLAHIIYKNIEKNIQSDKKKNLAIHPAVEKLIFPKFNYAGIIEKFSDFFEL